MATFSFVLIVGDFFINKSAEESKDLWCQDQCDKVDDGLSNTIRTPDQGD